LWQLSARVFELIESELDTILGLRKILGTDCRGPNWVVCTCYRDGWWRRDSRHDSDKELRDYGDEFERREPAKSDIKLRDLNEGDLGEQDLNEGLRINLSEGFRILFAEDTSEQTWKQSAKGHVYADSLWRPTMTHRLCPNCRRSPDCRCGTCRLAGEFNGQ